MLISRAIHKHGPEAFDREIIEECSETELGVRETFWINEKKSHVSQGGYNLTFGGDGGLPGYQFSEASKEKIRQKALGRKHTHETKVKMSVIKLGKKQAAEHVARRAATNTGKKRTEEQKIRISESLKGHFVSDITRKRIGKANSRRVITEKTKQKFYKPVEQLTIEGTVLNVYKSLTDASKAVGLTKGTMCGIVRQQKMYNNYRWRYQESV
jgi:group I intron endonuclease